MGKKVEFDVYECEERGHLILIEASTEKNEAEDVIRCPYHKCPADFSYSTHLDKQEFEDNIWRVIENENIRFIRWQKGLE